MCPFYVQFLRSWPEIEQRSVGWAMKGVMEELRGERERERERGASCSLKWKRDTATDSRNSVDRPVNSRPEFYSSYVSLTLSLLFRIIYATLSYYFTENIGCSFSRAVNASRVRCNASI